MQLGFYYGPLCDRCHGFPPEKLADRCGALNRHTSEFSPPLTVPLQEHLFTFDSNGIGDQSTTSRQGLPTGGQEIFRAQSAADE